MRVLLSIVIISTMSFSFFSQLPKAGEGIKEHNNKYNKIEEVLQQRN